MSGRDLRSFCVVARRVRGQSELGLNRLEIIARHRISGRFWLFRRRVEKSVCSRRRFDAKPDNALCRFAGIFTGATGLEPATSGVTGRSWRFPAERGSAGIPAVSGPFGRAVAGIRGCLRELSAASCGVSAGCGVVFMSSLVARRSGGTRRFSRHRRGSVTPCRLLRWRTTNAVKGIRSSSFTGTRSADACGRLSSRT
jgi:hypothetical protein